MQKIVHPQHYEYVHSLFSEIEQFFSLTSERVAHNNALFNQTFDNAFIDLHHLFSYYGNVDYDATFVDKHYSPLDLNEYDEKNIILCFSGGKDGVACLKHYIEEGYNVYLYHVPKINPSQNRDETNQAIKIAEYFNVPIYVEDIKISGKHDWVEHPMKNMIIAECAIQWGIKNNIGYNIAFGNYITSTLKDDNFAFCGGDDIEMWCVFEDILHTIIPSFEMHLYLINAFHTMSIICSDKELLDMTVSCLGRASLRKRNKEWVETTFGVNLPTYRCGQCSKCCAEYLWMVENKLQPYNKKYYAYCLNRLRINLNREHGVSNTSIDEVCDSFMIDKNSEYLEMALADK